MKKISFYLIFFFSLSSFSQEYKFTEISVISPNKDTLWLMDDSTGRLIAYSWEIGEPGEKKPVILFVERLPIIEEKQRRRYIEGN